MKIALVTGASTGIGRATSILLAQNDYKVYLVARNQEKLQETQSEIARQGGQSEIVVTDLSNIASINNLITEIKAKESHIDAIVNIAGIWHSSDSVFANTDFQDFAQATILDTYTVGFTAPTLIVHGLLPLMGEGSNIINLSGTFEDGGKGWLPYYASKRAIEDLTVGLSQELEGRQTFVNCVSPSDTATDEYKKYFPEYAQDANSPETIAQEILRLCLNKDMTTGKVFVVKSGQPISEHFHA